MILEDGEGSGKKAGVTDDHLLKTVSYSFPYDQYVNRKYYNSYSLVFHVTPSIDDAKILYIKNQAIDDLDFTAIEFYSDSTQAIEISLNQIGTPVGGTPITPINRFGGAPATPSVDCQYGSNITGLSGGGTIDRIFCTGNNNGIKRIWESGIIVPQTLTLVISAIHQDIDVWLTLSMYFNQIQV